MVSARHVLSVLLSTSLCAASSGGDFDKVCPLPPLVASYHPAERTALASHPRAGSTWLRFLVERITSLPSGVEKTAWGNVLAHHGDAKGPQGEDAPNREGVVVKTHSCCNGCWRDAGLSDRATIASNTTFSQEELGAFDPDFIKSLQSHGNCLLFPPQTLEGMMQGMAGKGKAKGKKGKMLKLMEDELVCNFEYDRAIVLHRDPLDVIKSNYHYRSSVLKMRPAGTWAKDNHEFARERGESFVDFFWSWRRFAERRPALDILYEDLKADPAKQLRRIAKFLGVEVDDDKIACAVNASTMDRLKESKEQVSHFADKYGADQFFGSRADTETKEDLSYPNKLLRHFKNVGLFQVRYLLGYPQYKPAASGKGRASTSESGEL